MPHDPTTDALIGRLLQACEPHPETHKDVESRIERLGPDDIFVRPISLSQAANRLADPFTAPIPAPEELTSVLAGVAAYVAIEPGSMDRALLYVRRLGDEAALAFRMSHIAFESAHAGRADVMTTGSIIVAMLHAEAAQQVQGYSQTSSASEPSSEEIDELFNHPKTSPSVR